jgi:multidrug efflux pump
MKEGLFAIRNKQYQLTAGAASRAICYPKYQSDKIKGSAPKILEAANKSPVLWGVDADLKFNKPEIRISIDRAKASELGVSVWIFSQTLQLALSNQRMGYFTKNGKQYQVLGQVERINREIPTRAT